MGYLTTITFRNDSYSSFGENKNKLVEEILNALKGIQISKGRNHFSIGSETNPVILQKPRHGDDKILYLHAGNTVIDVNAIENKNENDKWFIDEAITQMEQQITRLKKLKNE